MKELSISKNKLREIRYDVIGAFKNNVHKHPQVDMRERGIHLLAAVPETIADCWICLTDYQGELPEYINEIKLEPHSTYWRDMCEINIIE